MPKRCIQRCIQSVVSLERRIATGQGWQRSIHLDERNPTVWSAAGRYGSEGNGDENSDLAPSVQSVTGGRGRRPLLRTLLTKKWSTAAEKDSRCCSILATAVRACRRTRTTEERMVAPGENVLCFGLDAGNRAMPGPVGNITGARGLYPRRPVQLPVRPAAAPQGRSGANLPMFPIRCLSHRAGHPHRCCRCIATQAIVRLWPK
jgi:hypothetical protein